MTWLYVSAVVLNFRWPTSLAIPAQECFGGAARRLF
jgi:hypothetical protein